MDILSNGRHLALYAVLCDDAYSLWIESAIFLWRGLFWPPEGCRSFQAGGSERGG
ncbi:hypothetical protein RADP37_05215 [Roseomonas mucosa]|uniref:Uncharacterized protein n=1 Tax=Roseomonas mucosa TaxID=207340 RepID=A0A4Y1MTS9_9PROT|nr:hypothetical protein RADP37_05215 [Roseomonas mucosa]QDD98099.1 hypothetical protein ADP8_05215 [Roseomonas mucosa]